MNIDTQILTTAMGMFVKKISYLTDDQFQELNKIGYSGRNSEGKRTSRTEFLNSLGIGKFDITQTKFDSGDLMEEFVVVRVY